MTAPALESRGAEIVAEVPMKRLGSAEDIAGVAIFLSSPASAYLTGAVVPCDGGQAQF